jgi:XTP/dITP diphosphohydrolase
MTRKFSGGELVFATHNNGKLEELRALFGPQGPQLYSAADFNLSSPAETGSTFLENATLKALFVAQTLGKPALADDSGFCVDALDGAPGVYSADWAETVKDGPRDFNMAINKVQAALGDIQDSKAAFVTCLVLAWPDGHCEFAEGRMPGSVVWPPRGSKGFGYDPIFVPEGHNRTFAEMEPEAKNAVSHRAAAFRAIKQKCFMD